MMMVGHQLVFGERRLPKLTQPSRLLATFLPSLFGFPLKSVYKNVQGGRFKVLAGGIQVATTCITPRSRYTRGLHVCPCRGALGCSALPPNDRVVLRSGC